MKNNYLLHAGISSVLIFCISCGDIDQKTNIADSDAVSEGEMLQKRAKVESNSWKMVQPIKVS